jgi:hypothetical protein
MVEGAEMSCMKDAATKLRNQYADMSVHELVCELAELGTAPVERFEPTDEQKVVFLEAAIRNAVIHEAAASRALRADTDSTDLSKLSSTEIIAKIVNLALNCSQDSVWTSEANARLHPLVVVLKQAIIREASVGHVSINPAGPDGVPALDGLYVTKKLLAGWNDYDLVPKETL